MFLLGFLVFGTVMFADLSYSLAAGRDKTLAARATRVTGLLRSAYRNLISHKIEEFNEFVAATPEGALIRVFDSKGAQLYPADNSIEKNFPWPNWTMDGKTEYTKVAYNGRLYRVLSTSALVGQSRFRILIGGQLEENRLLLSRFRTGLFWTTPVLLLASSLLGYFLSRRALNPVARLIASARSISIGNLSRRLPMADTRDELQLLAETCNDMLGRLEIAVNQINRFTADASHELRHPISYIYTLSEYAARRPAADSESVQSFTEIAREAAEATRLLEDMLTLARADAGHVDVTYERLDLCELFLNTSAKSVPLIKARHHEIEIQTNTDGPVWIYGDTSSLRRLFLILLDNAIKYTPEGGLINLSLHAEGPKVHIRIRDNGIGIPEVAIPNIFQRFYRVENARSLAEGTGLGLAIAKWIAEIHNAELTVASIVNSGSTFQLSFSVAA